MKVHHEIAGPDNGDNGDNGTAGEVVVLSGSVGSNLAMWDPQVGPLVDAGYRVVRYDHRGHGRTAVSDGPITLAGLGGDVVELLDELGVERAHVVGLSLGGMTGMWLAANRPDRVGGLVLCCTSARLGTPESWRERAAEARAKGMSAIADASIRRWFTEPWLAANPQQAREYHHMTAATPTEGYARCCEMIGGMDLRGDLPTIAAPTLVIAGADDAATPAEHGRLIAEAIPDARFELVDQAAHLGNAEQPERFTELVVEHLKGLA